LGTTASQRKDWTNLESIGVQLKKISPQSPGGYLFRATARFNQGDPVNAEADLNQLVQGSPENPMGYAKLGQLRAAQKRWSEAEHFYQEALKRAPDYPDAVQGMVDLDLRREKPAEALQFIQTQIDRDPSNAALYLLQGQSYVQEKRLTDAERSFSRCIELDKQNLNAFILLAQVDQAQGHPAEAINTQLPSRRAMPACTRLWEPLTKLRETGRKLKRPISGLWRSSRNKPSRRTIWPI
jgi:predicted Zn-dependent protease